MILKIYYYQKIKVKKTLIEELKVCQTIIQKDGFIINNYGDIFWKFHSPFK